MKNRVVIIGAGIGGLVAAARLAHAGCEVTVIEAQNTAGGKMRSVASDAGPVDAGPTVLTMRSVFEELFADLGAGLSDQLTLKPLDRLARHYWDDGTSLDLMADQEASAENIAQVFGTTAADEFRAFSARAARLFDAFDAPMMQKAEPRPRDLAGVVLRRPGLLRDMAPHQTLAGMLRHSFSAPKLAQLFGRYATYVGGSPYAAPALLALIAQAEAGGVWAVQGGMHRLAQVIEGLAQAKGAVFHFGTPVTRIALQSGRAATVETEQGRFVADAVLFNGDPRALREGLLGPGLRNAVPRKAVEPRSLSAYVHAFAGQVSGPELCYHTVFFGYDPRAEFDELAHGRRPTDATLYICAQDRAEPKPRFGVERFEIILNGPPLDPTQGPTLGPTPHSDEDIEACQTQVFTRLARFGLHFDPQPGPQSLTTPAGFAQLFPGSSGSLYGRSPHGLTAGLARPVARTAVPGLYLTGGGAHPGAGVPMAALSARHAVAAIMSDLALPSTSRRTAMRGGISTGSAMTGPKASRS